MEKVARECVEFGEENCSKGKWCRKTGRVVYPYLERGGVTMRESKMKKMKKMKGKIGDEGDFRSCTRIHAYTPRSFELILQV